MITVIIMMSVIVGFAVIYVFVKLTSQPKKLPYPITPTTEEYEKCSVWAKETYVKWDAFLLEPAKYKVKETFIHWTIYRVEKRKRELYLYQIPPYIEKMWDNYYIINLETGETREVEQQFLDDLKELLS